MKLDLTLLKEAKKENRKPKERFYQAHQVLRTLKARKEKITPYILSTLALNGFNFKKVVSVSEEKLYLYRNGIYSSAGVFVEDLLDSINPCLKQRQMPDILRHIRNKADSISIADINKDSHLVPCRNVIFNRKTGKAELYNPKYFLQSKIATDYPFGEDWHNIKTNKISDLVHDKELPDWLLNQSIPNFVHNFMSSISNYDKGTEKQLWQVILDSLEPNCNRGKAIINHGKGGCGKSSFTHLILSLVGTGNYSSVNIDELNKKDNVASLQGRVVNVGDDLSDDSKLFNNATFKKLVTGGNLTINQKWEKVFTTTLNLTLIQNENHFARISGGAGRLLSRRLLFIGFDHEFNNLIPQDDLFKILDSKLVREYVLYKALHQPRFKRYARTSKSRKLLDRFLYQNNPVQAFFSEFKQYDITRIPRQLLYNLWSEFQHDNGFSRINRTTFYSRLSELAANDYTVKKVRYKDHDIDNISNLATEMNLHLTDYNKPEVKHSYSSYVKE